MYVLGGINLHQAPTLTRRLWNISILHTIKIRKNGCVRLSLSFIIKFFLTWLVRKSKKNGNPNSMKKCNQIFPRNHLAISGWNSKLNFKGHEISSKSNNKILKFIFVLNISKRLHVYWRYSGVGTAYYRNIKKISWILQRFVMYCYSLIFHFTDKNDPRNICRIRIIRSTSSSVFWRYSI